MDNNRIDFNNPSIRSFAMTIRSFGGDDNPMPSPFTNPRMLQSTKYVFFSSQRWIAGGMDCPVVSMAFLERTKGDDPAVPGRFNFKGGARHEPRYPS
jgi:hypothetical protein